MSKTTRNSLLLFGIALSLALLFLRISSQFGLSGDLRMFSGVLGYEGTKSYAVFLLDRENDPLLFQFTVSNGGITFVSVRKAGSLLAGLQHSGLAQSADLLKKRIVALKDLDTVDAVGFVTSDAAKELMDAFEGFYIGEERVTSRNLHTIMWDTALPEHGAALNHSISFSKKNVLTHSRAVLAAIKDVFSKKWVAVYFSDANTFGKSCLGACETGILEYAHSDVSLTDT